MIIKPQKGTVFAWWFYWLFFFVGIYILVGYPLIEDGSVSSTAVGGATIICTSIIFIIGVFTKAFSTYWLDYEGITQKCFFVERYFCWKDFKFIRAHKIWGGMRWLRCSTVALPTNMTEKEFEKKTHWSLRGTITIEFPHENGDEFYREFLSYCGGERDIRE